MCTRKDDPILQIFQHVIEEKRSLKHLTEERAARLESPFGRLPADYYGWSDAEEDEPGRDEKIEEEARRQEQGQRQP